MIHLLTLGRTELIDKLLEDEAMKAQKSAVEGLEDLRVLFKYLELYGITDKVQCMHCVKIVFFSKRRQ